MLLEIGEIVKRMYIRRGIVGIESAIVMIAFVIVAAALAFVVLNMGFSVVQQSKAVIQRGLGEASSALELDGTVVAHVNTAESKIDYWFATVKLSAGQHQVDLTPVKTVISYWSPQRGVSLSNTYLIAITTPVYDPDTVVNITKALLADKGDSANVEISGDKGDVITLTVSYCNASGAEYWCISDGTNTDCINPSNDWQLDSNVDTSSLEFLANYSVRIGLPDKIDGMAPGELLEKYAGDVISVIAWITKTNDDTVLDPGEKVLLLVYYSTSDVYPESYDIIKAEVKVPVGAPLTIERSVPPSLTQEIVDLG